MGEMKKTPFADGAAYASKEEKSANTDAVSAIPADTKTVSAEPSHHRHHSHHHSHHHGHHHHRHHHSHHSRKHKSGKISRFFKQNKSVLINVLSCTVSVALLFVLAAKVNWKTPEGVQTPLVQQTQDTLKIETSIYPEKVMLASDAISYYLQNGANESVTEVYKSFGGAKSGLNKGLPLRFTYQVTGIPAQVDVASIELELSESETQTVVRSYTLDPNAVSIDIYNLKTDMAYDYRVDVTLTNECTLATVGSFETARSPRILNIDGAVNVRDIGGWKTIDGHEIKQGLLYRGSEIDGAAVPEYKITDRGLQQMIGELGVRFEMDLRDQGDNPQGIDALGKNVVHTYYSVNMYSDLLEDKLKVKKLFTDLADERNYPVYLHCTYGRDRTGSVCYLLEALLGVSDGDLRKDYELSAFTDSYVNTEEYTALTNKVRSFKGDTTQQKVENYLLSIGVTKEQIKTIKDIFLGE